MSWQEEASQEKGTSASEEGGSSHDKMKAQQEQNAEHRKQVDAHYNRYSDAFSKRSEEAGATSSSSIANEEAAELDKDCGAGAESTCMRDTNLEAYENVEARKQQALSQNRNHKNTTFQPAIHRNYHC